MPLKNIFSVRHIFILSLILLTSFSLDKGKKKGGGTCTGDANCTSCTNCRYCNHCSSGGKCGVCAPPGYYKKKTATKTADKMPKKTAEEIASDKVEFDEIKQHCKTKISKTSSCSVIHKIGNCCGYECNENLYTINDGTKDKYSITVYDGDDCYGKQMIIYQNLETNISCKVSSIEKAFEKIQSELANKETRLDTATINALNRQKKNYEAKNQPINIDTKEEEPAEIFTVVEEMPEFVGGQVALSKYVQKNLQYPKTALENGISGKCFIKFVVNPDGSIGDINILKGVGGCKECDEECIRLMKSMPNWKPGKQNGRPVAVWYNYPINFTIKAGQDK